MVWHLHQDHCMMKSISLSRQSCPSVVQRLRWLLFSYVIVAHNAYTIHREEIAHGHTLMLQLPRVLTINKERHLHLVIFAASGVSLESNWQSRKLGKDAFHARRSISNEVLLFVLHPKSMRKGKFHIITVLHRLCTVHNSSRSFANRFQQQCWMVISPNISPFCVFQ
jgi:hypothetical protein